MQEYAVIRSNPECHSAWGLYQEQRMPPRLHELAGQSERRSSRPFAVHCRPTMKVSFFPLSSEPSSRTGNRWNKRTKGNYEGRNASEGEQVGGTGGTDTKPPQGLLPWFPLPVLP